MANTALRADQVVMQNGDVINGNVLSLNANALVLKDDNLGTVTLSRAKISRIIFGTPAANASLPKASPASIVVIRPPMQSQNTSGSDLATALRGIRDQTNLIQQVQTQILGSSSPDAINKFNQLLDDLSSGQMNLSDLRAQAQSAADQLRSFKQQMGPEVSEEANGYLTILDDFLRETAPGNAVTNSIAP